MRYRGHFERITAFKLVIILVSLLVIIGLPTHPQKESLANTGSSSPVNYPKSKTGDLDSAQTPNPHSQFAAEVGKVVDTLTRIEETLVLGQNPHQEFTYLLHSKQTIKKLNDTILGNFISVRQHCEQFALGEEILNRCAISLDNYTTTEKIVIESITAVLEAKKPVKDKERTPKENHSQSNTGAMNLGVELANSDTLLAIVTDSLEVLQTLKLKCEPDLHNSRPSVWEVQTAELDPGEFFDPTAPSVNVMAEAAATPPVPADLAENIDVQITDEIIDKAEELAYSASAIYEFVRNECEFQPYFGSRKGSVEALRQRSGNDYDLASLAIALLRASGIEARYATGIVEIPVDRANSWLGVDDGQVASSILYTMGLEGMSMVDGGGQVVAVRCRRVWVETYVSRGRGGGMVWVPLDPAFSLNDIHYGIDIPADMGLDAQAFIEEYYDPTDPAVILPRAETPLELLKQDISDYLAVNEPNKTVETVKRTQEIVPENLGLLPASLPYKVLSRDASFSEIPADKVYQIRFHLRDGGTTLIDETFDLPEIAGKRVTISYVGATPTDQATIDSYGGIYQTPPYLVHLKPVLRVDGAEVAIGTVGVPMGLSHSSDIHFLAPTNDGGLPNNVVPAIYNTMTCGAAVAIAFCTSDVSENLLQDPPEDDTEGTAQLLYSTAVDYLAMCHNADQEIGSLMHCFVIQDLADAIVENVVNVTFSGGTPQTFEWVSMRVDADRSVLAIWPVDGIDYSQTTDLMILGGSEGSVYEHVIFEDSYEQEAVSTIKILELAADEGITIYKRWDHLPLPANTLSSSARAAIEKAISIHGHVVTFPAAEITAGTPETGEWTGTGWIDMDPASGAAGYIISGNNNGGVTVDSWPPEFVDLSKGDLSVTRVEISIDDPSADSPDGSAIFPRMQSGFLGFGRTSKKITFKYRLHVFYDDGSDVWLPKPILGVTRHYKRTTHYTAKQFAPGHYMFKIWVSRWISWETLAAAERKVSIVGVFIRKDNGSPLGTDPPKYLPVKPATGSVPAETFKAVIIPSDLSGSGSYSWSTGWWFPKLSIKSPSSQITDVEPAGSNPSGSVDAEELDVTFTPSGGPECLTDEAHKMTVYKAKFEKVNPIKWGYDEYDASQSDPPMDIISVQKNDSAKVNFVCEPSSLNIDIVFSCDVASIATISPISTTSCPAEITVSGKNKDKAYTLLKAKQANSEIAKLGIAVYKENIAGTMRLFFVTDSTSSGTSLLYSSLSETDIESYTNNIFKQGVMDFDIDGKTDLDINYDKNSNGILDLEPDRISNEENEIINNISYTGTRLVYIHDTQWNYYLSTNAATGDTTIKLKNYSAHYMNFVGQCIRIEDTNHSESITVSSVNNSTHEVTLSAQLTHSYDISKSAALIFPLGGLSTAQNSTKPMYVEDVGSADLIKNTFAHELGHTYGNLADLSDNKNVMYYSVGIREELRYRTKNKKYGNPPGTEKQWDQIPRN